MRKFWSKDSTVWQTDFKLIDFHILLYHQRQQEQECLKYYYTGLLFHAVYRDKYKAGC